MTNLDSILKSRDMTAEKGPYSQTYGFSIVMYGYESWTVRLSTEELILLNCGVGEDSWESPLNCKEIKPVNHKGNQPWIFTGRTDADVETLILWPPDVKNWLIRKDPGAGKDWRREEKGTTEDEMVGWHHWLDGCEFEQAPGVGDGWRSLVCCSPWGRKESDMCSKWSRQWAPQPWHRDI